MLTPTEIAKAIKSATTETWLNDTSEGRGSGALKLRIRPGSGGVTATWTVAWKQDGQRAFKPLGRYPEMTIGQAREAYRRDVAPLLLSGKDPRTSVAVEGRPTVEAMFAAFVQSMREKGRASADETERMLLRAEYNAADALGRQRLVATIDPGDIAAYVARFYKAGRRGAADKARAYVSSAFGWAIKSTFDYTSSSRRDWGLKSNPAAFVQRDAGAIQHRDRNLSAEELRALWDGARADSTNWTLETAACVRMLILCGQRVQETLRIEGCEIDLQAALWRMPAHKTKGRVRPHTVPLPALAVDVLRPLVELHGDGPLFPARAGSKGELIDHRSIKQVIDRWNDGKMPPFQTRDLRRTWKSRTGEIGISREMRDLIQQHTRRDVGSKAYDRADYLPQMRAAMDLWNDWLATNVVGEASKAMAAMSAAAAGAVRVSGAGAATLGNAILAATGTAPEVGSAAGTLAATLGAMTATSAGKVRVAGSAGKTLAPAAVVAAGGVRTAGSLVKTLDGITLATNTSGGKTGQAAITLGGLQLAAAGGVLTEAGAAIVLGGIGAAASGQVRARGVLGAQLGDVALTGRGTVGDDAKATVAATLGSITVVADGRVFTFKPSTNRTWRILAESRQLAISAEHRVAGIERENRTHKVA